MFRQRTEINREDKELLLELIEDWHKRMAWAFKDPEVHFKEPKIIQLVRENERKHNDRYYNLKRLVQSL